MFVKPGGKSLGTAVERIGAAEDEDVDVVPSRSTHFNRVIRRQRIVKSLVPTAGTPGRCRRDGGQEQSNRRGSQGHPVFPRRPVVLHPSLVDSFDKTGGTDATVPDSRGSLAG